MLPALAESTQKVRDATVRSMVSAPIRGNSASRFSRSPSRTQAEVFQVMKVPVLEGKQVIQTGLFAPAPGQFQLLFADVGAGHAATEVGGQVAGG